MFTNTHKIFKQEIIDDAIKHAKEEFPNEACGAVINNRYERFENKADDTSDTFVISDNNFYSAYIAGEVECVIHSHDDYPMASKQDQIQQREMEIPFGIINLKNNNVLHFVFWGDSLPIEPLEGRHFFFGVWDCFSLARDHAKLNHNMIPPDPLRDFAFWHKGVSMYEKYIEEGKFPCKFIDLNEIEPGDYVLYNLHNTKYVNHVAIVLDDGLILHHLYNEISRKYPAGIYRDYMRLACRFNSEWEGWHDQDVWRTGQEVS